MKKREQIPQAVADIPWIKVTYAGGCYEIIKPRTQLEGLLAVLDCEAKGVVESVEEVPVDDNWKSIGKIAKGIAEKCSTTKK